MDTETKTEPWIVEAEPNGITWTVWEGDTEIAEAQTEANARLIASAPDLQRRANLCDEALEMLAQMMIEGDNGAIQLPHWLQSKTRALLAKEATR